MSKLQRVRILRAGGGVLLVTSAAGLCLTHPARADRRSDALSAPRDPANHAANQPALAGERRAALRFEPNRGQFEAGVRYLARGKGYALYLTQDGATLALSSSKPGTQPPARLKLPRAGEREEIVISMRVVGARAVEPRGLTPLQGANNYFVGQDQSKWRTGVESYASVRYDDVRPGVSVLYYGNAQGELEYDLLLAPGSNTRELEIAFDGAQSIELEPDGGAILRLPGGAVLRKPAPSAYQIDAQGRRVSVPSRYEKRLRGGLGFALGDYDQSRLLAIDPVLLYSTYLGGSSFDQAYGIASDAAGDSYVVGYTTSTLFPTIAPLQPSLAGGLQDAFVCKLSPTGALIYSTFLGGSGADQGFAIAADVAGNAYVTGVTLSTDFPTVGPLQATPGGKQDAFVAKLNANGSALSYSTYLGGSQDDYANGIAVGPFGNAYVIGTTFSANLPRAAALQAALGGTSDAFVSNLSPSGGSLVYSTYLGGSGMENGYGVATDAAGNAIVVGSTASPNFPVALALQPRFGGGSLDGFVSKLNPAGSALGYSTYLGGALSDEAIGVAVNGAGLATVAGYTFSANFPSLGASQPSLASAGHSDAFVSRLSAAGSALLYSTYLGGTGDDSASGVSLDGLGTAYVVGSTNSAAFPVLKPITGQSTYHGAGDGFVTAVDPSGSTFSYSTYLGGNAEDHAVGVATQLEGGTTHIVGNTFSSDFPVLMAPVSALVGSQDAFVTRLPGASVLVPAGPPWDFVLLAAALLGAGLFGASLQLQRKRLA